MKRSTSRLFFALAAIGCLCVSPSWADLGLRQVLADRGAPAVGQAVLVAARSVYADGASGTLNSEAVKNKLIAILNEAVATGNEQAIRYAIVAVMIAGGVDNLALSKAAINNSDAFLRYETLTAVTVAAAQSLIMSGGGDRGGDSDRGGGGERGGGDKERGGGSNKEQGGGSDRLFPWGVDPKNPFTPGSGSNDGDLPATRI